MCISPNTIRVPVDAGNVLVNKFVSVPCGHCYECVRKRKLDWEIRLTAESCSSAHTFFGMLTYNDEFYHSDVDRDEIAYYIKRLRYNLDKFYPGARLKYFLVSEYGELKDRLHYHVLYFVSSEFTDTHREFEELCKMSWTYKFPLSKHDIAYRRHCFKSWCKQFKPKVDDPAYVDYRNWSRRRYDNQSLGFATCQMLKHGTAIGSIHYACKYIQKQYNRMFYSHLGYDAWIKYMIDSGKFEFSFTDNAINPVLKSNVLDYPLYSIRGKLYPVPKRWLVNSLGGYMTKYYSRKLASQFIDKEKIINEDRLNRFWYDEPDRLQKLKSKEIERENRRSLEFRSRLEFEPNYNFYTDVDLWQTSTTLKRSLNCPDDPDWICPSEIPLPLRWD